MGNSADRQRLERWIEQKQVQIHCRQLFNKKLRGLGTYWKVTLSYQDKTLVCPNFHLGPAYQTEPGLYMVLNALLDDANLYESGEEIEGVNYEGLTEQVQNLKQFVGEDYRYLLWGGY